MKTQTQVSTKEREFIIRLIQQDLKVYRFRRGLQDMGFYSDIFYTDIPQMVLELMGYGPDDLDMPIELYLDCLDGLDLTRLVGEEEVKSVAEEVYGVMVKD